MWVIVAIACLVVLLCIVLCVPLDMILQADFDGKPKFRLRLSWLFGLVSREIAGGKKKPAEETRAEKGKKKHR